MTAACAVFVKTPGLSPIKTRLAAGIGAAAAGAFYELAVKAVEEVLSTVEARALATPYWAIAERDAAARWPTFSTLWQGDGGLADRLDRVYAALLTKHDIVYLVGADCPQLAASDLAAARVALDAGAAFAIGPARDGGFYLLAGRRPIRREAWLAVPMSAADTGARLAAVLAPLGGVAHLATRTDVDQVEDLDYARQELASLINPVAAQRVLLAWLSQTPLSVARG